MSAATASAPGAAADAFGEILRSSAQPSPQEKRSSKTKDPFLIRTGQTAARRSRRRSRRTAQTCRKNSPAGYFFDRLSCSAATCRSAIQIGKQEQEAVRTPVRHRCVPATTRKGARASQSVSPAGHGTPPIPDGLYEKVRRSPLALSPHFPTFSLSANTFSILTEALRSVSSLRCV